MCLQKFKSAKANNIHYICQQKIGSIPQEMNRILFSFQITT